MITHHLAPRRLAAVVLLPFGAAYFLSYALRNINALLAGTLIAELHIGSTELGLLTGILFLAMAAVQIPFGAALDRFGPRRVQASLLLLAVVGAGVTSTATTFSGLLIGRILIGIGTSTSLMAGLKAVVLTTPPERIARANGILIMIGALGAVAVTAPAHELIVALGWRGVFALSAALAFVIAATIAVIAPDRLLPPKSHPSPPVSLSAIYADLRFRELAPLSALTIGSSWSLQGLWAGPWLTHVAELAPAAVISNLLIIGLALACGAAGLGWISDRLKAHGIDREVALVAVGGASLIAMSALVTRLPIPPVLPWAIIAIAGAATTISYAILPGYFAASMSGRANAALNLLHLVTAFLMQFAIGGIIDLWPAVNGHPPAEAYRFALGVIAILQALALGWFVLARSRRAPPVFTVRHPLLHALSPVPVKLRRSVYDQALASYLDRLTDARAEAGQWRRAAFGSAALCVGLVGMLGGTLGERGALPYLVSIDAPRPAMAWLDAVRAPGR